MSHEERVQLLVQNELMIAKESARAFERIAKRAYSRLRTLASDSCLENYLITFEEEFNDTFVLLEINLEEDDLQEIKRMTVVLDILCVKIQFLLFMLLFHKAIMIILM